MGLISSDKRHRRVFLHPLILVHLWLSDLPHVAFRQTYVPCGIHPQPALRKQYLLDPLHMPAVPCSLLTYTASTILLSYLLQPHMLHLLGAYSLPPGPRELMNQFCPSKFLGGLMTHCVLVYSLSSHLPRRQTPHFLEDIRHFKEG